MNGRAGWFRLASQAARIVPSQGISAWLTVAATGAIVFVTTLALAFAFAAARASDDWRADAQRALTLRIDGTQDRLEAFVDQAIIVLQTTPGIEAFRLLEGEDQARILSPWLEAADLLPDLDLPRLITITPSKEGLDTESLSLRLQAEVPAASLMDHSDWVAPLARAADRIALVSVTAAMLALGALTAMTVLSVQAAMAANRPIIEMLRLLGAHDGFIANSFIFRLTSRAVVGAAIGVVLGVAMLYALPAGGEEAGIFSVMRFEGLEWAAPALLIPLVGLIAFGTTYLAAHFLLRRLT